MFTAYRANLSSQIKLTCFFCVFFYWPENGHGLVGDGGAGVGGGNEVEAWLDGGELRG